MQRAASPLGSSHLLLWCTPTPRLPQPVPSSYCGLPLTRGRHLASGKHVPSPQRTSRERAVPAQHLHWAVLPGQTAVLSPRPKGDEFPPSVPQVLKAVTIKPLHLWGSTPRWGGLGETPSTPTTWFKNSSNFQQRTLKTLLISNFLNLFIPTDRIGVRSHKIHFLIFFCKTCTVFLQLPVKMYIY